MKNKSIPNLFIVGAAKSATTSVYKYLQKHNDIYFPSFKEPSFLSNKYRQFPHNGPGDNISDGECIYKEEEYYGLFKNRKEKFLGEASVDYLYYYKTADEIFKLNPNAKIIICLRNPVDRAFSAYWHLINDGREYLSFEEGLEEEENRIKSNYEFIWHYKRTSLYYKQVKYYLDRFGRDNVFILIYEEFAKDPYRCMNEILTFLELIHFKEEFSYKKNNPSGEPKFKMINNFVRNRNVLKSILKVFLPKDFRQNLKTVILNKNFKKPEISKNTKQYLHLYFKKDIEQLERLTGLNLSMWQYK